MNDELRPCPFCGGKPEKMTSGDGFTSIGCLRCNPFWGVMIQSASEFDAITAWNTRDAELAAVTPLKNTIFELLNTLLLGARSGEGISAKWCRELYEKYKGLDQ